MPERLRATDAVRAGARLALGPVLLLPIERTRIDAGVAFGRPWCLARKDLVALLVRDAAGLRAYDGAARELPLDELQRRHPAFEAWRTLLS